MKKKECRIEEALHEAFLAALLLTVRTSEAERAVEEAINGLGPDLSADELLVKTALAAVHGLYAQDEFPATLPRELRSLSVLAPTDRKCFVLRILMGFDRETCCEILGLSRVGVEEALHRSLLALPEAIESISVQTTDETGWRSRLRHTRSER